MNIKYKNRKGQAILFAVVGITIALAIGVTVASRNLSSISRTSRSDTSERAFAAAEGGIERLLVLSGSELDSVAGLATNACNLVNGSPTSDGCNIVYPSAPGDPIQSSADLKVQKYISNATIAGSSYLSIDVNNGDTVEVNLRSSGGIRYNGNLTLCWQDTEAAIYYSFFSFYGGDCTLSRGALKSDNLINNAANISDNGFSTITGGGGGFSRCKIFNLTSTQYDSLRVRALYKRTLVGIFADGLPEQGYKLIAIGKILGQAEMTKRVIAYRTFPFMPSVFDSAIFSEKGQIN